MRAEGRGNGEIKNKMLKKKKICKKTKKKKSERTLRIFDEPGGDSEEQLGWESVWLLKQNSHKGHSALSG